MLLHSLLLSCVLLDFDHNSEYRGCDSWSNQAQHFLFPASASLSNKNNCDIYIYIFYYELLKYIPLRFSSLRAASPAEQIVAQCWLMLYIHFIGGRILLVWLDQRNKSAACAMAGTDNLLLYNPWSMVSAVCRLQYWIRAARRRPFIILRIL